MAAEAYPVDQTVPVEFGRITLAAAAEPGDVLQYHDGRACVVSAVKDLAIGDDAGVVLTGIHEVPFASGISCVKGAKYWWDESANAAIATPGLNVGDYYLGIGAEDKASATGMRGRIDLNREPAVAWSLRDGSRTGGIPDTLQEVLGLGVRVLSGGSLSFQFDAVAEAATASLLSGAAFPIADQILFQATLNVIANGDASAFDAVVGLANDDHATDPDSITEAAFVSINGASTNINAESDDGTTEVAATDTTKDFTAGTPFSVWIDARDKSDVKIYVDGARVLSGTTFDISAATGPLRALALMEKTSDDTAAQIFVLDMSITRIDDAHA